MGFATLSLKSNNQNNINTFFLGVNKQCNREKFIAALTYIVCIS
jgi:hypothetical protein